MDYPRLPQWAKTKLDDCVEYLVELHTMVHISSKAIRATQIFPTFMESVVKHVYTGEISKQNEEDKSTFDKVSNLINELKEDATTAKRESENGFPLLTGMAIVLTWGALETYVYDLMKGWLENNVDSWKADEVQKLKIKLGEFMQIEKDMQYEYIIEMIDNQLQGPLKAGIGRFEILLGVFNLSGSIDDDIKKTLFEMSKIRNAIVHNKGIADKKLVDTCPSLSLRIGDSVLGKQFNLMAYIDAVIVYIAEIQLRIFEALGIKRNELINSPIMNLRNRGHAIKPKQN